MAHLDDEKGENHLRFDEPKFSSEGDVGRKQSGADHKGSIYAKPDLENGEEYANLVAYISSYYEGPRRKSVVSMEAGDVPKKPWWKFWAKGPKTEAADGTLEIPDDVSSSIHAWMVAQFANDNASGSRPTSSRVSRVVRSNLVEGRQVSTNWFVISHESW